MHPTKSQSDDSSYTHDSLLEIDKLISDNAIETPSIEFIYDILKKVTQMRKQ